MNELRDELIQICKDRGESPLVDFEWYLPASERTLASSAVEMVCQGTFRHEPVESSNVTQVNRCESSRPGRYKGPSAVGSCRFIGDKTCKSDGPDLAAGAIHLSPSATQLLHMTTPYYNFKQLVVKRPKEPPDLQEAVKLVFAPFSLWLWVCIVIEMLLVWVLLLGTEGPFNDEFLEGGWTLYFDTLYWSISTMLAGVDKDAVTFGGKVVFTGHLFFCFILVATYTGAVSAFLTQAGVCYVMTHVRLMHAFVRASRVLSRYQSLCAHVACAGCRTSF